MTEEKGDQQADKPDLKGEKQDAQRQGQDERVSITEKLFTAFSLLLILSICVFLVLQSLTTPTPPEFSIEASYPMPRGNFLAVEVYVENSGEEAAKAVHLAAEMPGSDGKPAEAEATLDWLPGNSRRKATLMFPGDVVTTSVPVVKIRGYEAP